MVGQEKWLFIAWVFGRKRIFTKLYNGLVYSVGKDNDGKMTNYAGHPIEDLMPHGTIGE
jgi:hypothetical protein